MSSSYSATTPPSLSSLSTPLPDGAGNVSLGYGIAIAVGILILISTIMLASYACVRAKGGYRHHTTPSSTEAAAARMETEVVLVVGGLDPPTIESYPKFIYPGSGRAVDGGGEHLGGVCSICLGEYAVGEVLRRMPDCKHSFHAGCVDEWLRMSATCPMCRQSPVLSPIATPLSEFIPLAINGR